MSYLDVPAILSVGIIGFGFLLAFMAYSLLREEQKRDDIHRTPLSAEQQGSFRDCTATGSRL